MKSLLLLLLLTLSLSAADKGLWVVRHALMEESGAFQIAEFAHKNKITDIYVHVRALGEVYYPATGNLIKRLDSNSLERLIKEAHDKNIRVHAWINSAFVWSGSGRPNDKNHIFNKARQSVFDRAGQLEPGFYIYPGDSANISEIKLVIKDMARHYGVDGIHLDYFRYPFGRLPLSIKSRTEYMAEYHLDPARALDEATPEPLRALIKKSYREFLKTKLTEMLAGISAYVKQLDPHMELSLAVKPNPYLAEVRFFQPWEKWIREGLCDFVAVMNYDPLDAGFEAILKILDKKEYRNKVHIGIGVYNITAPQVRKRINQITVSNFAGYALFSYNYIRQHTKRFNTIHIYTN